MNRRVVAVFALVGIAIVALWWFAVYSPKGDDLDTARADVETAERDQENLRNQLAQLEAIAENGPAIDAELAELADLVPPSPDLAGFILGMNELAIQSGIDWLSVAPAQPQAVGTNIATINLGILVEGGFFQVLDYLNRLEDFDRLVITDGISITSGSSDTETASVGTTLSVQLTGRMFTTQLPASATTTTTTPSTDTTTTTGAAQ